MQLKYRVVFDELQSKILSGYWPENAMIPTEFELCDEYDVSRITVRRALDDLVQLGLVRRVRGKGTFVSQSRQYTEIRNGLLDDNGTPFGAKVLNKIIEDVVYGYKTELARNFFNEFRNSNKEKEGIVRIKLLEMVEERPHSIKSIFMTEETSALIDRKVLRGTTFIEAYEQRTKKKVISLQRSVSAVIPDEQSCTLLGVKTGTAHLWMKNKVFVSPSNPIAISYTLLNGNLFDFAVNIDLNK